MSVKILKKNCHQVLGSQKSKLTPPELVFQTAGAINPPPYKDRVKTFKLLKKMSKHETVKVSLLVVAPRVW